LFGLSGISDFGARYLDKTIGGRFWSQDPLATAVPEMTTYHYAANNPLSFIDPTGMSNEKTTGGEENREKVEFEYTDGYGTYSSKGISSSISFNGFYNAAGGDGDKGKKKAVAPIIPNLPRPTPVSSQPTPPTVSPTPVTPWSVFLLLASIMQGDESSTELSPATQEKDRYIYREMATNPDGSWIQSPLTGAPNARQMGVRTPNSVQRGVDPDIIPVGPNQMVGLDYTGLQGLSASSPPRPLVYKNTIQGRIKVSELPIGLGAVNDHSSHYSIFPVHNMTFQK
jgi:hypothetical protein